ncbi:MAG: XRE family transcriptional regulator [Chromatiaceae bacterium]
MKNRRNLTLEEAVISRNLARVWNMRKRDLDLTQEKAADELGFKSQSAISQYLNGYIPLNTDAVLSFARLLRVAPEEIDPNITSLFQGQPGHLLPAPANVGPASLGKHRIPLISYVKAGRWQAVSDPYPPGEADDWLLTSRHCSGSAFALRIKGRSMLPRFEEGDDVIIDPSLSPRPGDFVVAKNHQEEATFKKYRPRGCTDQGEPVFELVPLNEDYATLRSDQEPIVIIGVMIEHRHYRQ